LISPQLLGRRPFTSRRWPEVLNALRILLTLFIFVWDWPRTILG
jgi:hypothetical protein